MKITWRLAAALMIVGAALFLLQVRSTHVNANAAPEQAPPALPFTDYRAEAPGVTHHITAADLPEPFATKSAVNDAHLIPRPKDAWPQAPKGFKVELYADGLNEPRLLRTAPNGDFFVAESRLGEVKVFRGVGADGKAQQTEVFATGLTQPFGIAFYPPGPNPQWVYVANTDSVVRFPYHVGDMKATGAQQVIVPELPGGGRLPWRRALDARRGIHAGRKENVYFRRFAFQCG